MILFDLSIKLPSEKTSLVLLSLLGIVEPVRVQPRCNRFRILVDSEDDDTICVTQTWETREALEEHIASEDFRIVLAAMDLAVRRPVIQFFTVSEIAGFEFVEQVRARA